jgi:hypothetical protein
VSPTRFLDVKTRINLAETVLDFPKVVGESGETCRVWDASGRVVQVADFATVIVGWDQIVDERWRESVVATLDLESRRAPIFTAPEGWLMAHVLKALGGFGSVGEARRNGWDKPIESGMTDHVCRIRKIRGCVTTFKPTPAVLGGWPDEISTPIV